MKHLFYRRALYERIWTETPTRVAAELKISTTLLKQACHRAAIPLPTMTYWSGLRADASDVGLSKALQGVKTPQT